MDNNTTSIYSQQFTDEFNSSRFYAQPKKTKLYVRLRYKKGGVTVDRTELIGNAIVANIEESNDKIPTYSYNSDIYVKYLNGKKIVTGSLILRKTTVDQFISLVLNDYTYSKYSEDKEKINSDISVIDQLMLSVGTESQRKHLFTYKNKLLEKVAEIESVEKYTRRQVAEDSNFSLLYFIDLFPEADVEFMVEHEGELKNQKFKIKDVLFVKKQTDMNIHKSDIVEVYQFIGNPTGKMEEN